MLLPLLLLMAIGHADGHFRIDDPPARNQDPGLKTYPCGGDAFGSGTKTTIAPGFYTVVLHETINHKGAPFRFALSYDDDSHYDQIVLYDHLPHNDATSAPNQYAFNLSIPDINCPNCALQVINPMTDKIAAGACCSSPGTCFSVYHSCSDIAITGSQDPATWAATVQSPLAGRCGEYSQEATAEWVELSKPPGRWGLSCDYTGPVADTNCQSGCANIAGALPIQPGCTDPKASSAAGLTPSGALVAFAGLGAAAGCRVLG
jgi:hypothetical protein